MRSGGGRADADHHLSQNAFDSILLTMLEASFLNKLRRRNQNVKEDTHDAGSGNKDGYRRIQHVNNSTAPAATS